VVTFRQEPVVHVFRTGPSEALEASKETAHCRHLLDLAALYPPPFFIKTTFKQGVISGVNNEQNFPLLEHLYDMPLILFFESCHMHKIKF
jgi:hypothetical protein